MDGLKAGRTWALAGALVCAATLARAQGNEFIGIVYPLREAMLSVHVAGVVEQVQATLGQRVAQGESLLVQDARIQQSEVERRRIVFRDDSELRTTEQRRAIIAELVANAEALYKQAGTISLEELMKLRLELVSVSGRLDQLREAKKREAAELQLAERERDLRALVAPMPGVITLLKVHPGEWAAPGEALVRLVDDANCELRVNVAQAAARRLAVGGRVSVKVEDPALPAALAGRVSFISPVVDAASTLVEVRVQFTNPDRRLRPGVKARLRVEGPA